MTIHKLQGQTMTRAVMDIGNKEMAAGCTLSRLKTLSGLLIQPMTCEQLRAIGFSQRMQQRITEEQTLSIPALNVSQEPH